uniref:Uncharacterized protein n=1 Tax=Aureoumbra lagunensis TaxID=44058 RepID=A0A7S3JN79_9STRA
MNGHTVLSNNGQHEQQDYEVPPTCVLMGIVRRLGKSSAEATEETVARACWQYGRVLDARVRGDDVHVFFESEAAALRCQWQLNVIDGVTPTRLCTENIDYIHVEVKVNYEANTEMELALGRQCTQYGRVIEAVSNGKSIHLAMATETGAAASVIGLESGENEIVDSASLRLSDSESSPFVFVPQSALKKNNISEEDMKKEFQRFGEVLDISRSENVQIQFATSTQAARCCAEVTSSQFCVRGSICRKFDSEFAAQVIATLPMTLIEKTIRALRHEIDSIPRNHQAFALLAGALLRLDAERYADEALEHAQTAIELAPKFAWGHFRKGSALLAMGHVAKAATSLGLASSLDSENTELAHAAVRVKQTAEKLLDPLDAFVATEINAEAAEQLIQAVHSQRQAEIETDTKKT